MKALVFLSFPDDIFFPEQKLLKYFSIGLQMKTFKSLLTNRYSICIKVVQWNLYKADTIRSKKSVRFMEMSAL